MTTFFRPSTHRNDAGLNLIEMVVALGIMGLVVGGIFAAWSSVSTQNQIKASAEQIALLVKEVRALYAGQSNISGTIGTEGPYTTSLTSAGIAPQSWVVAGATVGGITGNLISNPWGNFTSLFPATITSARDAFFVRMSGIKNRESCQQLLNRMFNGSRSYGLVRIVSTAGTYNISNTTVLNDISPACGTAANGARGIRFYYMLKTN